MAISWTRLCAALFLCLFTTYGFASNLLYISEYKANKVDAYDLDTNTLSVVVNVPNAGGLVFSNSTTMYVTDYDGGQVVKYDLTSNTLTTVISSTLNHPAGLALSPDGSLLYIACAGTLSNTGIVYEYNIQSNVLTPLVSDLNTPFSVAVSPDGGTLYIGEQALVCKYDIASNTKAALPITGLVADFVTTVVITPDGKILYIANGGRVIQYNIGPQTQNTLISSGLNGPLGMALSSDSSTLYIANDFGGTVSQYVFGTSTLSFLISSGLTQPAFLSFAGTTAQSNPPTNLTGKQRKNDVGMQYELFNQLHWEASTSSASGYCVYRDGTKIATVSSSTFQYQDHNRKKGVSTVYSVTALSASGLESLPISITIK